MTKFIFDLFFYRNRCICIIYIHIYLSKVTLEKGYQGLHFCAEVDITFHYSPWDQVHTTSFKNTTSDIKILYH